MVFREREHCKWGIGKSIRKKILKWIYINYSRYCTVSTHTHKQHIFAAGKTSMIRIDFDCTQTDFSSEEFNHRE